MDTGWKSSGKGGAHEDRPLVRFLPSLPRRTAARPGCGSGGHGHILKVRSLGPAGGVLESGRDGATKGDAKALSWAGGEQRFSPRTTKTWDRSRCGEKSPETLC